MKNAAMVPQYSSDNVSALEAKDIAQWIAFGPIVFQAARVLRNTGILQAIEDSGKAGITMDAIIEKVQLPTYGVRVLLEAGLGMLLFHKKEDSYCISKTGYYILHDNLTRVNMDFVHDVCYKGMFNLDQSIQTGKPAGLNELGNWETIYEGLSQLPSHIQQSWLSFDHFFSDLAFGKVLKLVLESKPKKILDIGGNTGKWAIAATRQQPGLQVTIMDLPGQLEMAGRKIAAEGLENQVSFHPANILDPTVSFPKGFDTIFMSQFLDCFSEEEIIGILKRCHEALDDEGTVFILEAFWDLQRFETASFCLQQTSLYFTCLANGNSQMYDSKVFLNCVDKAGFTVVIQHDNIGLSHTLLQCRKK